MTIHLEDGKRAVSEFPIPTGGSGMDWEARKEWVAKRLELAFGKNPSPLLTVMEDPEVPVRHLVSVCLGVHNDQ